MEIEQRIIEQRTTEAIKKNLMGYEGKIFLISKILGKEIIKENEASEVLDFYNNYDEDPNSLPTFHEDASSYCIGHSFDGLGYGYHLNITFMEYENSIKLWFKGYLCYHEEGGDLRLYIPLEEWENIVNKLFEIAETVILQKMTQMKKDEKKVFAILKNKELQRLRNKWGNII